MYVFRNCSCYKGYDFLNELISTSQPEGKPSTALMSHFAGKHKEKYKILRQRWLSYLVQENTKISVMYNIQLQPKKNLVRNMNYLVTHFQKKMDNRR